MVTASGIVVHRHLLPSAPVICTVGSGFTSFTLAVNARVYYVSWSVGDDAYDGLYSDPIGNGHGPKKTLRAGQNLLRTGFGDWLLLRRGDTWTFSSAAQWNVDGFKQFWGGDNISGGGQSLDFPMLIAGYGSGARPKIVTNSDANNIGSAIFLSNNSPPSNYLAFVGFHMHSGTDGFTPQATDSCGIYAVGQHAGILIEDMRIEQFGDNVAITTNAPPAITDVIVRRNILCDASRAGDTFHGQGLYVGNIARGLFEENAFIHNGFVPGRIALSGATWIESSKTLRKTGAFASYTWASGDQVAITGGTGATISRYDVASKTDNDNIVLKRSIGAGADTHTDIAGNLLWVQCFNWNRHNVYLQDGMPNVIFRGNILTGTDGVQQRCGGIMQNNLSIRNAFAFQYGVGTGVLEDPNGVSGYIRGNIAINGGPDFSNSGGSFNQGGRGSAFILGNTNGVLMDYNIATHNTTGTGPTPIILGFDNRYGGQNLGGVGIRSTTLDNNIVYDWGGIGLRNGIVSFYEDFGLSNQGVVSMLVDFHFTNNDIQNGVDSAYLFNIDYANMPLAQVSSFGNRFYRASGSAAALFRDRNAQGQGQDRSFAQFMADINDGAAGPASTNVQVTYTDPSHATIADYYAAEGGEHGIAPDGSFEAFIDAVRLQGDLGYTDWAVGLLPTKGGLNKPAGTPWNGYPLGSTVSGPLRWLRQKFSANAAAMGLRVDTVSPSSGTHLGGTLVTLTGVGFQKYLPATSSFFQISGILAFGDVTILSDTQLQFVTDSHSAGVVDVTVDNGDGVYTKTSAFTYT